MLDPSIHCLPVKRQLEVKSLEDLSKMVETANISVISVFRQVNFRFVSCGIFIKGSKLYSALATVIKQEDLKCLPFVEGFLPEQEGNYAFRPLNISTESNKSFFELCYSGWYNPCVAGHNLLPFNKSEIYLHHEEAIRQFKNVYTLFTAKRLPCIESIDVACIKEYRFVDNNPIAQQVTYQRIDFKN